jgi:putative phage-type endonuclease
VSYEIVKITPDTPEWLAERLSSIGASEVAAVLGLSKWQTPLSVYNSKMGVPSDFPEELSYVTHASEDVVAGWVTKFHPEFGTLEPGFMARSTLAPWLHATFDRILLQPDGSRIPLQIKTGHQNAAKSWDDGVPAEYRIQEQLEMFVYGAQTARLVVMHGGRTFAHYVIERDNDFLENFVIPITREFWRENVLAKVAPQPSTAAEAAAVWPANDEETVEATEADLQDWVTYGALKAAAKGIDAELATVVFRLQQTMKTASQMTYNGAPVFAWKESKPVSKFDTTRFKLEHARLAKKYISTVPPARPFTRSTTNPVKVTA